MSNEAAERILARLGDDAMGEDRILVDAALAAERRETVERIRALTKGCSCDTGHLAAILDAEATDG